jgi:hypothetical protein
MIAIFNIIKTNILKIIILFIAILFFIVYQAFTMMAIEDKLGDFKELYYSMNKSDSYLAFVNNKKIGFVEKIDDDIYFLDDKCLIHILEFSNDKIEVYKVEIDQTYTNLDINQTLKLKSNISSELIFKN